MNAFDDLYHTITQTDEHLIVKWQKAVNKRVKQFVKNVSGASPFLDKPNKRMFGVRNSKDGHTLTVFGTPPNAGRMKAFQAPTNEWRQTTETFHIYGDKGWRTIHKVQMVRSSVGVPTQNVRYYGTSERPDRYFGIQKGRVTLAYGRTRSAISLPIYARDSYADWIMQNHRDEIDNIILESGRDVLSEYTYKKGAK